MNERAAQSEPLRMAWAVYTGPGNCLRIVALALRLRFPLSLGNGLIFDTVLDAISSSGTDNDRTSHKVGSMCDGDSTMLVLCA